MPRAGRTNPATMLAEEAVLQGAAELLRERRWREISVEQIARQSGIGRGVLYRHCGSRRELAGKLLQRERTWLNERVRASVEAHAGNPAAGIGAALAALTDAMANSTLVAPSLRGEAERELELFGHDARSAHAPVPDLAEILTRAYLLASPDGTLLAETLIRLALTHRYVPATLITGKSVTALLGPYLAERSHAKATTRPHREAPAAPYSRREPRVRVPDAREGPPPICQPVHP